MRALLLTTASLLLTTLVLANAYVQKQQFYPSVVYITKSNPSLAVLYVQAFVFVILMGKLFRKMFFGTLRAAEMEHLIERSWYAITETCLAFTVFREDLSPKFIALFTLLLFIKSFHWLGEDRVDYMERSPIITVIFHCRVIALLLTLAMLDSLFIEHAYQSTLIKGASVQLVFGFEYAILLATAVTIFIKYILHTIDLGSENPWESKAVYMLYTELLTGCIKVALYLIFMFIMIKIHTFPLFAIRPMYLSMRQFKRALNDVVMSRRAIRNMNTLYPDATPEELQAVDNVCIICRDQMITGSKKLPCNHIFHASCLRSWFQRQQTCPTCRMDVLRPPAPPQTPSPDQAQARNQQQQQQQGNNNRQTDAGQAPVEREAAETAARNDPSGGAVGGSAAPAAGVPPFFSSTPRPPGMPPGSFGYPMFPPTFARGPGHHAPPPFFMPPPPMFPMMPTMHPFSLPVPTPPNMTATPEELAAQERQLRQSLEARVQWLRDIHTLFETAVVQLNQYSAMMAAAPTPPVPPTNEPGSSDNTNKEEQFDKPSTSGINLKSQECPAKQGGEFGGAGDAGPQGEAVEEPPTAEPEGSGEMAEIRRRRLEKLTS